MFVLNYDENDGIFDHVAPPIAPAGTAEEYLGEVPIGPGFRVPCLMISPWSAGGWVCSQPFDHTSHLRFLEKITGVIEPNISDYRRRNFGDLTEAFRFSEAAAPAPVLPDTSGPLTQAAYEAACLPKPDVTGTAQRMPAQEKGQRRRVPLA